VLMILNTLFLQLPVLFLCFVIENPPHGQDHEFLNNENVLTSRTTVHQESTARNVSSSGISQNQQSSVGRFVSFSEESTAAKFLSLPVPSVYLVDKTKHTKVSYRNKKTFVK
jgi:hypothetical protein